MRPPGMPCIGLPKQGGMLTLDGRDIEMLPSKDPATRVDLQANSNFDEMNQLHYEFDMARQDLEYVHEEQMKLKTANRTQQLSNLFLHQQNQRTAT